MLKQIVSISGRPGLYKLVSQGKGRIIVESVTDHKRLAASGRDKVVGLGEVAMYTTGEDVPLAEVLDKAYARLEGKTVDAKHMADDEVRALFAEILPDYDDERVRNSDIRKLLSWYNILVTAGFDHFSEKPAEDAESQESQSSQSSQEPQDSQNTPA